MGDLCLEGLSFFFLSMLITLCVPTCPQSDSKRSICRNSYILYFNIWGRNRAF